MSNPPDPNAPPPVTIEPGQSVTVDSRNVFKSPTFWGLAVTLLSAALKRFGWHIDPDLHNDLVGFLTFVGTWVVGPGMILWDQRHITRPMGFGGMTKTVLK